MSHPSWVRGLKHPEHNNRFFLIEVAPLVGAWIETAITQRFSLFNLVAPLVGAWIETNEQIALWQSQESHPSWVRGLKQEAFVTANKDLTVAPLVGAWIETIYYNYPIYYL